MITKIGVIYQDRNSFEFLLGLQNRLGCVAELIPSPTPIGKPRVLPRRQASSAWQYFRAHGVDLVVRFTDADRNRWQDVFRSESDVIPEQATEMWICGIAVNNVEECMALDIPHLATTLGIAQEELADPVHRTDRIKRSLARLRKADEGSSDVVARIVREAPRAVFRKWLEDVALRRFYSDCRAAAARADCPTPNELDDVDDA